MCLSCCEQGLIQIFILCACVCEAFALGVGQLPLPQAGFKLQWMQYTDIHQYTPGVPEVIAITIVEAS